MFQKKKNHKVSFHHLKQRLISRKYKLDKSQISNLNSVKLVNVVTTSHVPNAPNVPNLNSQNPLSYSNNKKVFTLS
jgi:hypothetical protein